MSAQENLNNISTNEKIEEEVNENVNDISTNEKENEKVNENVSNNKASKSKNKAVRTERSDPTKGELVALAKKRAIDNSFAFFFLAFSKISYASFMTS